MSVKEFDHAVDRLASDRLLLEGGMCVNWILPQGLILERYEVCGNQATPGVP